MSVKAGARGECGNVMGLLSTEGRNLEWGAEALQKESLPYHGNLYWFLQAIAARQVSRKGRNKPLYLCLAGKLVWSHRVLLGPKP